VVETTNFKDQTAYRNSDGSTLRLIEHFADRANTVEWKVTADDPTPGRGPGRSR
jgi:hypothetical protein